MAEYEPTVVEEEELGVSSPREAPDVRRRGREGAGLASS